MSPIPCSRCGATLRTPVRFCPFCGAAQHPDAPAPAPNPRIAPVPPVPPAPVPPVRPVAMSAESVPPGPAIDAAPDRSPVEGPAVVAAGSAGADPGRDRHRLRTEPPPMAVEAPIWADRRTPRDRTALHATQAALNRAKLARANRKRFNRNRPGAIRKLAAAAFVLGCAAVLWRQLVMVPHATLTVHLERPVPGAAVLVDGIADGAPDQPISLASGQHRIGLDAAGFDTPSRSIALRIGETATVTLYPSAKPAELVLNSSPNGASISLDGRAIGRTPLQRVVPPGRHRIVATAPNTQSLTREVVLPPGASSSVSLALSPVPLRRLSLVAPPAGQWSAPLRPGDGTRFTLLFRAPIRVRIAGRVLLLEPGAPVSLGAADADGLSLSAVGDQPAPVRLSIVPARTGDATPNTTPNITPNTTPGGSP